MLAEFRSELVMPSGSRRCFRASTIRNNAIVTLHAGAGGTESCDWAAMLYRMYTPLGGEEGLYDGGTGLSGRR